MMFAIHAYSWWHTYEQCIQGHISALSRSIMALNTTHVIKKFPEVAVKDITVRKQFPSNQGGQEMINNMVLSTEIEWIGYEHKDRMLQVEFIEGPVYRYQDVPENLYEDFLHAPSHGRFFEAKVKGKYEYKRIR